MPDEKNHLYSEFDSRKDRKETEKRRIQQQFSRFSTSAAIQINNSSIVSTSPALQPETKVQIGDPYDDTKGSVGASTQVVDFSVYGSGYTFYTVTDDVIFSFDNLPTGRFFTFTIDITVNAIGGVSLTFPQVTNPPNLAGENGDRYVLRFVGVNRVDPTGATSPVQTYTFLGPGAGGSSGGGETLTEFNHGTVTGGIVVIDWDVASLQRMTLGGDIAVLHNPSVVSGTWQRMKLEFLQDGTGGWTVTWIDAFTNQVVPLVGRGANRFTTVDFYAYVEGSVTRIFAFETQDNTFFEGIMQAGLSADQTTNIVVNNHIEWDTIIFNDNTITLSTGAGQLDGIFSGFKTGHMYECECYVGIDGSGGGPPDNLTYQWYDIGGATVIGAQGFSTDDGLALQQTAKAYFVPTSISTSIEVRITGVNNVTGIQAGAAVGANQSFVTIKDCGIFGEANLPANQDTTPPDSQAVPMQFNARMVYANEIVISSWNGANGVAACQLDGRGVWQDPAATTTPRPAAKCLSTGFIRKIRCKPTTNNFNKNLAVQLFEDGVAKGPVVFTILAGNTNQLFFPSSGNTSILLLRGREYQWRFSTPDQLDPTGTAGLEITTEVYYGSGLS